MMIIFVIVYLMLVHEIKPIETLKCYSCSGGEECGVLFSPKGINIKTIKYLGNDTLSSCSISVTPEGETSRDLVASHKCRSSSYEYCCNEDLCNNLLSPPLPALTSLKCSIGKCSRHNGICVYDAAHITVLSSATESCSITFGKEEYKYYKKGCQPTIKESYAAMKLDSRGSNSVFCCNSPECNTGHIGNAIKGAAIQCYTCDSRITGLAGCMIFNESSPYVYKAGSSSNEESCATIIGLAGRDALTGSTYPDFAIRTFIPKCVNQPLGYVSYGGAYFKGRIECCSSHFCNTKILNSTKDKGTTKLKKKKITMIISIVIIVVLSILIGIGIGWAIYRCCQKKYDPCLQDEPPITMKTLKDSREKDPPKQPTVDPYPERHAAP